MAPPGQSVIEVRPTATWAKERLVGRTSREAGRGPRPATLAQDVCHGIADREARLGGCVGREPASGHRALQPDHVDRVGRAFWALSWWLLRHPHPTLPRGRGLLLRPRRDDDLSGTDHPIALLVALANH